MRKEQIETNKLPVVSHYREYLKEAITLLNISEADASKWYGLFSYTEWNNLLNPYKKTQNNMEKVFIDAIEAQAEALKQRLIREAHKEWEQHRQNTELNPAQAEQLSRQFVTKELAMEVYYSLSVKP